MAFRYRRSQSIEKPDYKRSDKTQEDRTKPTRFLRSQGISDIDETLYRDIERYFHALLHDLRSANAKIDMEVYIYDSLRLGQTIAKAIIEAADRGVKVRLLTDGIDIDSEFKRIATELSQHGVIVRIFRPLPWRLSEWQYSVTQARGLQKLLFLVTRINKRNHRKTVAIDDETLYMGSINISNDHLHVAHGGIGWRDTAIRVTGTKLDAIREAFEMSWNNANYLSKRRAAQKSITTPFLFNYTNSLRQRHHRAFVRAIRSAKTQVLITNAYFVPENSMVHALNAAAKRGV